MSITPFKNKSLFEVRNFVSANNRNDKCWCDSGKKFKHCHLDRQKMLSLTIQEEQLTLKRIDQNFKTCLFQKFDNNCSSGVIKSHSVSKELFLRKISRNNKVYSPRVDMIEHRINMKELGIVNEASIFYGFCEKHDGSLFIDFEQKKFTASDTQLLRISYRSLCLEIFKKKKVIEKYLFLKKQRIEERV